MKTTKGYTKAEVKGRSISLSINAVKALEDGRVDIGLDQSIGFFVEKNGFGEFDYEYHHVGISFNKHFFVKLNDGVRLSDVKKAYKEYLSNMANLAVQAILTSYPDAINKEEVDRIGGIIWPAKNPTYTEVGYADKKRWYVKI